MNQKVEISIIIPAFNEEKRILKCLERTLNYCLDFKYFYLHTTYYY